MLPKLAEKTAGEQQCPLLFWLYTLPDYYKKFE